MLEAGVQLILASTTWQNYIFALERHGEIRAISAPLLPVGLPSSSIGDCPLFISLPAPPRSPPPPPSHRRILAAAAGPSPCSQQRRRASRPSRARTERGARGPPRRCASPAAGDPVRTAATATPFPGRSLTGTPPPRTPNAAHPLPRPRLPRRRSLVPRPRPRRPSPPLAGRRVVARAEDVRVRVPPGPRELPIQA
jgi:hypothetical protein